MIFLFVGLVLLTVELLMLSFVLAQKHDLPDTEREPAWWEQLVVLYHLPSIILLSLVSGQETGRYWVAGVVTFVTYLGLTIAVVLLGVQYLGWTIRPDLLSFKL